MYAIFGLQKLTFDVKSWGKKKAWQYLLVYAYCKTCSVHEVWTSFLFFLHRFCRKNMENFVYAFVRYIFVRYLYVQRTHTHSWCTYGPVVSTYSHFHAILFRSPFIFLHFTFCIEMAKKKKNRSKTTASERRKKKRGGKKNSLPWTKLYLLNTGRMRTTRRISSL